MAFFNNVNQEFIDLGCQATRTTDITGSLTAGLSFDEIDLTYNGDGTIATVLYKNAGILMATLTLTYSAGNLIQVVRT